MLVRADRATGLLLTHLPHICHATVQTKGQLWVLRAAQKESESPWGPLSKLAERANEKPRDFFKQHSLSSSEFAADPLASLPEADPE